MDKEFLDKNKPGIERPQQVEGAPAGEGRAELDPNLIWSPQPSTVYDTLDAAADEGNLRPGDSAIDRANSAMETNAEQNSDTISMQGHPFEMPVVEHQATAGAVRDDPDTSVALESGQGQGGEATYPTMVSRGPDGEISIVEVTPPTGRRPGT